MLTEMAPLLNTLLAFLGSPSSLVPTNLTTTSVAIPVLPIPAAPLDLPQPEKAIIQTQQLYPDSAAAAAAAINLDSHHYHHQPPPLQRRNFVWTEVLDSPQDLCGDSTFAGTASPGDGVGGPTAADCRELVGYAAARPGFWLITGFGEGGLSWVEFDVLGACKMAVRHADGGGGTIPIGNMDVIDLINSTIAMFSGGGDLPQVQGNMTCSQTSTAVVEWKLYGD